MRKPLLIICCLSLYLSAFSLGANERLVSDISRDEHSKPHEVIEFVGIVKGDHVLDFLGGGGYYSHLIASAVGNEGKVVLHNNQAYLPYVGKELEQRFGNTKFKNLERVVSEVSDFKFGHEKFDKVLFVLGYHDLFFESPNWNLTAEKVVPQISASLKPNGHLIVIDHAAKAGTGKSVAESLHRIEKSYVIEDLTQRGFKLIKSGSMLENGADPLNISAFDPKVRRKTNRFVLAFQKES